MTSPSHRRRWPSVQALLQALGLRRRRVRSATDDVLRHSTATLCPACRMLLGSVAQRRGTCPRCRAPLAVTPSERR